MLSRLTLHYRANTINYAPDALLTRIDDIETRGSRSRSRQHLQVSTKERFQNPQR